jgi:hypothetical protein
VVDSRITPDQPERPRTARRALLAGGAASLAAVAGTTLGLSQPAGAATTASVTDWFNVTDPSFGNGGADPTGARDSTVAINAALTQAGQQAIGSLPGGPVNTGVVYMPTGVYKVSGPLIIPEAVYLLGAAPASAGMNITSPDYAGTVIRATNPATATWGNFSNSPGVIYVNAKITGTSPNNNITHRPGVANLWIDGTNAPSGIHGISAFGGAFHGVVLNVGVFNAQQDGMHFEPSGTFRADGWTFRDCVVQTFGGYGISWYGQDTQFVNVHVQAAQASTTDSGCWLINNGNNCVWIGCRGDQGMYGFVFDTNPGGTPGSTQRLIGCGTENTLRSGLWLNNTSSGATQMRTPVSAVGCSFDFAGRDQVSAAIRVTGYNILTLSDTNVTCGGPSSGPNGGLYPMRGLSTIAGSAPGAVPALIDINGGFWNVMGTGTNAMINDGAPTTLLRYRFFGVQGTNIVAGGSPTPVQQFTSTPYP